MDATVVVAVIGAGTTLLAIILTAFLTYKFAVRTERTRIFLEREERKKQEEEAKKKVEPGTWEDVARTTRASEEVETRGAEWLPRLPTARQRLLTFLPVLLMILVIIVILILKRT